MSTTQIIFWAVLVGLHLISLLIVLRIRRVAAISTSNLREFLIGHTDVVYEVQNQKQANTLAAEFDIPQFESVPGEGHIADFKLMEDPSDAMRIGFYTPHLSNRSKEILSFLQLLPLIGPLSTITIFLASFKLFNGPETYDEDSLHIDE